MMSRDLNSTAGATAPIAMDDAIAAPAGSARSARRRSNIPVAIAALWLLLLIVTSAFAAWLPLTDPADDTGHTHLTPFTSWSEPLGTDQLGRSQLSRVVYGARISLAAGVLSAAIAFVVGMAIGLVAGYRRGLFDDLVGLITDALLSFPGLVVLLALAATMGPSLRVVVVGLSIVSLPTFIRLSRANTLRVSTTDFVTAARATGASTPRILSREVLPNIVGPVSTYGVVIVAVLIVAESSLSYLGLGVRPPTPTWGVMISEGQSQLAAHPWSVAVPGLALFSTVYSLNMIGEWLRRRDGLSNRI
ncbi:MAG: ABC transporter permease [Acidimicrobiales bacterium]